MGENSVFQSKKEIERLLVQNELLSQVEVPLFDSLFSSGTSLSVLDIGCNDGRKTVSLFSRENIRSVIGVEYNSSLSDKAEREYGNGKFRFVSLDAQGEDFSSLLRRIMDGEGIKSFDCIYLSFVLMHLDNPRSLLSRLFDFLSPEGTLVIVEPDDGASFITPDSSNLLPAFLDILKGDIYSGNRSLGGEIESLLEEAGYCNINIVCDAVSAGKGEKEKKEMIYTTFFSYLEEDVDLLLKASDSPLYRAWKRWLEENLSSLKELVTSSDSTVSMGMKILTAGRRRDEA